MDSPSRDSALRSPYDKTCGVVYFGEPTIDILPQNREVDWLGEKPGCAGLRRNPSGPVPRAATRAS